MGFANRAMDHDGECNIIARYIREHHPQIGVVWPYGGEADIRIKQHRKRIETYDDRLALMIRYCPDILLLIPTVGAVLMEVKTSGNIEVRSYLGLMEWGAGAVLCYYDKDEEQRFVVCANDILPPSRIFVPRRFDFEMQMETMDALCPTIHRIPRQYNNNGSGTPYMTVRTTRKQPFEEYMEEQASCAYQSQTSFGEKTYTHALSQTQLQFNDTRLI
jgi:hypothetical protein